MSIAPDAALDLDAWYAWDADDGDQGWLLTYVDVLSVILAMLLVLLARLGPFDAPDTAPPPPAVPTVEAVTVSITPVPESPARTASEAEPAARAARQIAPEPVLAALPLEPSELFLPAPEFPFERLAGLVAADEFTRLERDERGVTLKIPDVVLFDSARAELKPTALPILDKVAQALADLGDVDIAVHGHTDDRPVLGGVFDSNWALAAARANAVTAFLLERGFAPTRLRAVSFAATRPVADNGTDEGRARNRRVEIRAEFGAQGTRVPGLSQPAGSFVTVSPEITEQTHEQPADT